ncbi:MAG TPA: transcriptional regulator NrdR [Bacillota bacterium]
MRCPFCQHADSRVLDSRPTEEGAVIRRRRECTACGERFTTYERVELPLLVVKRDGRREPFSRDKILQGLLTACEKRPVPAERLERIVAEIERALQGRLEREVTSTLIGRLVLERLRHVDEIAYVRFASVYLQFEDLQRFREEIERLMQQRSPQDA